ncbi:MAG: PP0621 family protein [Thermoanaerobaculia bacterium]
MTRILGIILLLVVLRMAFKSFTTQLRAAVFGPPAVPKAPPPPRAVAAETLVQCAACGIYVASTRALKAGRGDAVFCSEECRRSNPHP